LGKNQKPEPFGKKAGAGATKKWLPSPGLYYNKGCKYFLIFKKLTIFKKENKALD
jgi:hypothetical protein